ncbi:MAG: 4-hydroxythreonine-4-phosphate dehydrogenase PdxA [Bacteroidota bacterium]|nr:4-hydroxythreonine-4-phosphate dehydrogenase PdxA [Bacteroidota bacterium]
MRKNIPNDEQLARVGITHGDINGIAYEIIMKALEDKRMLEILTPVVFGLSKAASYHRKTIRQSDFNFNIIRSLNQASPRKPNLIDIYKREVKIELGKSTQIAGEMSLSSLEAATEALVKNEIDVLVTAPINKSNIQSNNFDFPGHTEYLASKFNVQDYLMMMVCDSIRIGAITGHVPLKEVPALISGELIRQKVNIMHDSLLRDFSIQKPRIAVLSLNPHAGDNGLLGSEEKEVIIPAINESFEKGILVYGPYSADGFFGSLAYKNFDGVLGMYHDQTMLPFKLLGFDNGVNFTAGLPYVRTSPAHGTAYNIAGKDQASPDSFRSAMYLAIDIYNNRLEYDQLTNDPLKAEEHVNNGNNKNPQEFQSNNKNQAN